METGIKAKGKGLRHLLVGIVVVVILVATYFTVKNIEKIIDMYAPYKEAEQGGKNVRMKEFLKMRGEASKEMNRNAPSSTALSIPVQKQETLKVKGLYIGMDIYEACEIINQYLDTSTKVVEKVSDNNLEKTYSCEGIGAKIEANSDKKVKRIEFFSAFVDKLFNVSHLDPEQFAKEFLSAYGIPEMKPFYEEDEFVYMTGWEFISDFGFRVRIGSNGFFAKALIIEKVPFKSELKFD